MRIPKILLVDDQLSSLLALEKHLENLDVVIEKHTCGEAALTSLLHERADCILVDFDMPGMNGIEFLRLVKGDPELGNIPTILITGKVFSTNQAVKAVQVGAHDYLTKPVNISMLRAKVQLLVDFSVYRHNYEYLLSQLSIDDAKTVREGLRAPICTTSNLTDRLRKL